MVLDISGEKTYVSDSELETIEKPVEKVKLKSGRKTKKEVRT